MPLEDYGVRVWRVLRGPSLSSTFFFFFFFFFCCFFFFFLSFFTPRVLTIVGYANIVSPMGLSLLPFFSAEDSIRDFSSNARWVALSIQKQEQIRVVRSLGVKLRAFLVPHFKGCWRKEKAAQLINSWCSSWTYFIHIDFTGQFLESLMERLRIYSYDIE